MDVGPIPWTATLQWCEEYEIVGEQREDLFYHVQALDSAFLKWRSQENEKKLKKK